MRKIKSLLTANDLLASGDVIRSVNDIIRQWKERNPTLPPEFQS